MASPPATYTPAGSPPFTSASLSTSKKRGLTAADLSSNSPSLKRRKASTMSVTSASSHPLRQTSFPPDESQTQAFSPSYRRSPSVDSMSLVSGSQVSAAPVKKKRGRKSKADRAREAADEAARGGTPSAVNGAAPSVVSNASGANKGGADEDGDDGEGAADIPDSMASRSVARSKEEIKEEERLRALVKQQMDDEQFHRYEVWHRTTIQIGNVRKYINSVTSQSVTPMIPQAMQVVCKLLLGDLVEDARRIQNAARAAGDKQTDLPSDEDNEEGLSELSKHRRQAPLRPEHLIEAYRRWQASGATGGSGGKLMTWHQQTSSGIERFAPRAGGRRIFR